MAQSKILIDTNVYLRLGKSINPLLGIPFGDQKYALYLHKEIQIELNRSNRLENKFYWTEEEEYKKNRRKIITTSNEQKKEIEDTYNHIWEYQKDNKLGLSREDIYCIATELVLYIQLVTDDQNMIKSAKEFDVNIINTLSLIKMMIENNFINEEKLHEIVGYWKYLKDLPANFREDYKTLFGEKPPNLKV